MEGASGQASGYAGRGRLTHPYRALDATLLGVLGVHHWGLTLAEVNPTTDGSNPFPRTALLKALAAQVALDFGASLR